MGRAEREELLALLEEKLRRNARNDLNAYCRFIEIPGVPVSDDPDCEEFYKDTVTPAKHHELLNGALMRVEAGEIRRLMVFMPPGSAKALALDTPIPTPDGWKRMGDLRVGDRVFDENGKPCNVTWVSPIWRQRPVYRVSTDCGDEIIADQDHEWFVRMCGKRQVFKIKETWELCRSRSKRPMITRAKALELPEAELPVDPYLLGVWLGDGNGSGVRITSSVDDQPWLRGELARLGYKTSDSSSHTLFGVLGVRGEFVKMGLINDTAHKTYGRKHIPRAYMRASVGQRLALLQGLIDTDGTICKQRGCATFCNTNRELAEQVRELVRSLGVKAGWSESRAMLNGKDCGLVYRVSFFMKHAARMPRKAELCRDQYRTPNTYIDVDYAGVADTVCIEVDSPSHLFLCGRSMTPTHNSTYGTVVFPTWFMGRKPARNVICTSYGSTLAQRFGRKCRQITRGARYSAVFDAELVADNRAADDWSITNGSTYMAAGILAGITGNRADGLLIDDPIKGRADADSPTIRDKVWEAYKTDLRTRLKPHGFVVIIQTRWHEDDLSGRILPDNWNGESGWVTAKDGERWYVICLQAECTRADDPLGRQIGEWLWTDWFSPAHWEQEKRTQGERNWSALYQQCPTPSDGGIFKRGWFLRYATPPAEGMIVQSWDTGNKPGELNDPSVCTTWRMGRGYALLDVHRERMDFPTLKAAAINMAAKWKPDVIIIEDKASGQSLIQELRATTKLPVVAFDPTPHGDKVIRAHTVSPIVEAGLVSLPEAAPWLIDFEAEVFAFPLSTTKDQVDSVTQFLKWAHARNVELQAWGTGDVRAGLMDGGQSHLDTETGYGIVRSDTDTDGF